MGTGGTMSLAVFWLSSVIISPIFLALRNWSPLARRSLCYVAWLVIIHAACRQYERLAQQKDIFLAPSLSFKWLCLSSTQPDSEDEPALENKQDSDPGPSTHCSRSSSPVQRLEIDLAAVEKIDIDVLSRDLLAQVIRASSEPSTSASSSQLPSPVFSAISSATGCTSADSATAAPSSASRESLKC
ncbi:hypothetical protein C8T65DRAFT_279308 [Cerioporus squamosus]|nr:hypothetical protein C8T65DRAFT_279308 [Cerioporus squamosus]